MYDEVGPEVGPFEPENRLCFGPGVLAGTLAPAHSRAKITSVSPNGLLQNSGIGGYIPAAIRKAGYDNVIIQGKSDKPVYLYIVDDRVEVRSAKHIWGKDTQATQRVIKEEVGGEAKVACIGPAGENLVSFSCIVTGIGSAAGRGGLGAIMGAKNLKAIAVKGSGHIRVLQPSEFLQACKETHLWLPESEKTTKMESMGGHGDKYLLERMFTRGRVGNWEERDASWDRVGDSSGAEEFYKKYACQPQYGCFGCPVQHFHIFEIPGQFRGATKCVQWYALAGSVWVSDRKIIVHANILCDRFGLDSTGTGNAISFLMELYHRGIISKKDTDGIAMERGDEKAIFAAIEKIGKQEGFGRLFRNGVIGAAKKIGKGAEKSAVVVNGQEVEPYEIRLVKSHSLAAAIGDGTVVHGSPNIDMAWFGAPEESEKKCKDLFGSREAAVPMSYEKKAVMVWDQENRTTACDMTGTCKRLIPWAITKSLEMPAKLFSLATGKQTSEEELLKAGQRTLTLERAFRVLRGVRRDTLPERLFNTAVPDGIYKGERLNRKKFEKMLNEYYGIRGWDENGIPTEKIFNEFNLSSEWKLFKKAFRKGA
jgi:aldehyde:ferredoxin oxidoreductase